MQCQFFFCFVFADVPHCNEINWNLSHFISDASFHVTLREKQKKQRRFLAGYKYSTYAEAIQTESFQKARSDTLVNLSLPRCFFCELAAAPLCCFLQIILKRRPRVKRFILKSHSLTAEKSAASLLCNTPCISSTAWITCTAAANQISSECRLTLPRSLTDILWEKPTVFFSAAAAVPTSPAPLFTIHCHLPWSRLLIRLPGGISHTSMHACPLVALNRLETKDINVNNPWRDEWEEGRAQSIPLKFERSVQPRHNLPSPPNGSNSLTLKISLIRLAAPSCVEFFRNIQPSWWMKRQEVREQEALRNCERRPRRRGWKQYLLRKRVSDAAVGTWSYFHMKRRINKILFFFGQPCPALLLTGFWKELNKTQRCTATEYFRTRQQETLLIDAPGGHWHKVGTVKFFRQALSQMDAGYKCEGLGKGSIWLRFDTWKVDSNDLKCSMHVGTTSN